jgi:hypothetical protein
MKYMKNYIIPTILIITMISFTDSVTTIAGQDLIFEKTLPTQNGQLLDVDAFAGSIKVTPSGTSEVTVKAYGNSEEKEKIDFSAENSSEGVTVIVKRKSGSHLNNINLRLEISVPSDYNVELKTGGGSISVSSVKGKSDITTAGGSVTIEGTAGETRVVTMGGSISVKDFTGNVSVETNGGSIKLAGSNGQISASTLGGNISLDYSGKNQGIELNTNAGNIKVLLPSELDAEADLSTTCGRIECDFGSVNERHVGATLKTTIGTGGSKLVCSTLAGSITVNKK